MSVLQKKLKMASVLLHFNTYLAEVSKCSNNTPMFVSVLTCKNEVDICSTISNMGSMCSTMNVLHDLHKMTFVLLRF